jgi:predicted  nucleic acid-binding Zn-ribbon protein
MAGMMIFLLAAVGAIKVSPVAKVIELMDGLTAKVKGDLAAEEMMMEEYSTWCDSESNEKEDAITSAKRTIGDLDAEMNDAAARISELSTEVEELAGKISSTESDVKSATELRKEEQASFAANEKELVETVDGLERAVTIMKRGQVGGSFLQQRDQNDLKKVVQTLGKIVEASWVSKKDKAAVQALVQSSTEESDGDEDLSLQPQAATSSYESHGGGILETFEDMKTKAEETLSEARTNEMKAQHSYEMLKQSLNMELDAMNKRMSQATTEKAGLEEAHASAEEQLASTQKTMVDDKKYLEELKQSCSMKAQEWATRQKDAAGELAAIAKAKEVLESGVKVFLQVSNKAKAHERDESDDKRERVDAVFSKIGQSDHSYLFSQLRSEAREGSFDKVKGLIESMIARLEKQAAEEADAKAFCDTETEKSKAKQADLTAKSDKSGVRIEKATAAIAELKEQIKTLQEQTAEMDAAQAEATSLRTKEHEEFLKASKDYKDSADAVAGAISVLQEYYSSGSFAQVKEEPELGGAKTDIATTIMGMLEVAESDFTTLLAESEASEKAAQSSYDKLTKQNAITKAANTEEIKDKEAHSKSEETALLNYKEDFATTGKELDAVLLYLDKLKPQCETKVMTYAERVAKREAEIEGLKEALEILSA